MKKRTKYVTTVKSIPGATTEGMIHHVKCYVLTLQKIPQNILKLAEEVSDRGKRDVLVSGIINRGDDFYAKVQKVDEFLFEKKTMKSRKYIDNGNIGLGMLNRSKLHLNRFGAIQLVKNYCEILKTCHHQDKTTN